MTCNYLLLACSPSDNLLSRFPSLCFVFKLKEDESVHVKNNLVNSLCALLSVIWRLVVPRRFSSLFCLGFVQEPFTKEPHLLPNSQLLIRLLWATPTHDRDRDHP